MKATGIVRRIDDLGRIVVPKEIRRTLRIREGDPLEIFTDREGEIILKKYAPIGELSQFAGEYAESLAQTTGHLVLITDCDHVVTASGTGKKQGKTFGEVLKSTWKLAKLNVTMQEELARQQEERNIKVFTPVKAEKVTFKAEWSDCYNSNSRGYLGSQYCGD